MIYLVRPHRQTIQPARPMTQRTSLRKSPYPVVPDIAQSRLKCVDAGCIHRPLVQQIPPINNFAFIGSIWAVGLPVCPPVRLSSLACTRVPRKPRPRSSPSRLFRPAARRLPPVPAACDCPSIQATPMVTRRDNPIIIYRLLLLFYSNFNCSCV